MDDVSDLMERVWNQMNQTYKDLMKEVLSALASDYIHAFKDHNIATGQKEENVDKIVQQ